MKLSTTFSRFRGQNKLFFLLKFLRPHFNIICFPILHFILITRSSGVRKYLYIWFTEFKRHLRTEISRKNHEDWFCQKKKLYVTPDTGHLTCDTLHLTPDNWYLTYDLWHVVGGHSEGADYHNFLHFLSIKEQWIFT